MTSSNLSPPFLFVVNWQILGIKITRTYNFMDQIGYYFEKTK